jgi:hypothetical protein
MNTQRCVLCIVAIHISPQIIRNAYLHVKFPFFSPVLTKFWLYRQTVIKACNTKFHGNQPSGNWAEHTKRRTGGETSRQSGTIELIGTLATISESAPENCTFFSCSVLNVFCMISGQTVIISGNIINWLIFRLFYANNRRPYMQTPHVFL